MDSAVDSSIGSTNGTFPFRKWNINRFDVTYPDLELDYNGMPSMMSTTIQLELENAFNELKSVTEDISKDPIFQHLNLSIDPFWNAISKRSQYKYARDYYDISEIDKQLGLIEKNDVVMSFSPLFTQYLSEKECFIVAIFLGATGINDSSLENEDEKYWNFLSQNTKIKGLNYKLSTAQTFENRWTDIERTLTKYQNKVDLLINVENYKGRLQINGHGLDFDLEVPFYDLTFFEPLIRGLNSLKSGGKSLIQFSSFASKLEADICYLYKYLFKEIAIVKPSTSNPVLYTHYLIAKGFNVNRYLKLKPELDNLLNLLNEESQDKIINLTSFLTNLDLEDKYVGDESKFKINSLGISSISDLGSEEEHVGEVELTKSKNFQVWIFDINNQMAIWIYNNIKAFSQAKLDFENGYFEGRPIFNFDDASYRKSIGLLGRTTYEMLPDFETSDEFVGSEKLELDLPKINLSPNLKLGSNFLFYVYLSRFVTSTSSLCLPTNVSPDKFNQMRKDQEYSIREWLGILYAQGDFEKIQENPDQISNLLSKWTIKDIIDRNPDGNSMLTSSIESFIPTVQQLLIETLRDYKNLQANDVLKRDLLLSFNLKIEALQNLRFKLTFTYAGKQYKLMKTTDSSTLGEYDLLNLTTSDERKQLINPHQLYELIYTDFKERVFENCCLPILFSGIKLGKTIGNESAVSHLYFKYKPDAEAFASASNRYAPIWCSANENDKLLGSQGNFFGSFSTETNPIFDKIKLMIAFPPPGDRLLELTLRKCIKIIEVRQNIANIAIMIIYFNDSQIKDNGEILIDSVAQNNKWLLSNKFEVKQFYDPFTGKIKETNQLKAFVIKSKKSTFEKL